MKKSYKIDVDCANCALKMEDAAKKTEGVLDASVSFMTLKMVMVSGLNLHTLKMKVEFAEGANPQEVMEKVRENCKKAEADCEVFL